ncbi:heterokaryon incompatibility protein-domain-containing protein [Paraphoma chrysanthemicola]|nr:heterokaryon incompatibility protein-domain-containing protein [Paraphoma chrysanthemicola]
MTSPALSPQTDSRDFEYDSLDLSKRSIRLVRILPDLSSEGYLQCHLCHSSIDTEYCCLLYVWGPPSDECIIKIDGKLCAVRRNLFTFVEAARKKDLRLLWIDALCIDQSNIIERNHQVQQMGAIFSGARKVISWFGNDEDIATYLRSTSNERERDIDGNRSLCDNIYWRRAWITQEFLLARQNILMASEATLRMSPAFWYPLWIKDPDPNSTINLQKRQLQKIEKMRDRPADTLLDLLHAYKDKDCTIPKDRIFSLLALCRDMTALRVDYQLSDADLARNILTILRGPICLCGINALGEALDLTTTGPSHQEDGLSKLYATTKCKVMQGPDIPDSDAHDCGYTSNGFCSNERHMLSVYYQKNTMDDSSGPVSMSKHWLGQPHEMWMINLRQFCSRYEGHIRIIAKPGYSHFSYQYLSINGSEKQLDTRPMSDFEAMRLSDGEQYRISLSISFCFAIARVAEHVHVDGTCKREIRFKFTGEVYEGHWHRFFFDRSSFSIVDGKDLRRRTAG